MLAHYRVIDLTDERGQLAGMILAALGAEVILVEPPGGTRSRQVGPFAGDQPDPERSLQHWAYNRGKQSVVLDPHHAQDVASLHELLHTADVLITTGPGGPWAEAGLDPDATATAHPALVHVSITPFGSHGPKADWAASELTVHAASGQLALTGDADRAPVRISSPPQAFLQAAGDAAGAALIALRERARSGLGQHVDVSAQSSMMASTQQYCVASLIGCPPLRRAGGGVVAGELHVRLVWECADGHVSLTLLFGASLGPFARRLFEWMLEEGFCEASDRDKDWINLGMQLWSGEEQPEEWERLKALVATFLLTKTKAELLQAALERKLLFAPLSTTSELVNLDQLAARNYWDDVLQEQGPDHADRTVRYPGRICSFSRSQPAPLGPPARLGQHNALLSAALASRRAAPAPGATSAPPGVPRDISTMLPVDISTMLPVDISTMLPVDISTMEDRRDLPLAGLRVVDLMWAVAGPSMTRTLADYGATVIKIESERSVDGARTVGPFRDDQPGHDNTGLFHAMGANKLALSLDLSNPASRAVIKDLVRWADVLTESFSPKAMRQWGLTWDHLREINPRLVMLSSCLMGQSGPMAFYAGFGTMAAAICGFHHITGWADRAPVGPFSAYTDYTAPRFSLPCLLAALEERDRSGVGQYLDFSQMEASLHLLAPALLDYTVNDRVAQRQGNADPRFAPHGVYRCAGDDRWVAVVCESDAQWQALASLLCRPELGRLSTSQRLAQRQHLDELLEAWTVDRRDEQVEATLVSAGIPAHTVQNSPELAADPQLAHRGAFQELPHPTLGTAWVENTRFRLDRTPARLWRAGAPMGTDTWEILSELLGYDDDRIAELAAAEVLQ